MPPVLALYEDVLADGAALALPAAARMIFLVHGGATVAGHTLRDGETWRGDACRQRDGRDLLAFRLCFAARGHSGRRDLAAEAVRAARHVARGRASPARRQRRLSTRRL